MQKIDTHYVLHHYVCDYDDDDSKGKGAPTFQFIQHSKVRSLARHQHTAPTHPNPTQRSKVKPFLEHYEEYKERVGLS